MKTLTCRAMGGMCDEKITADSYNGMMMAGMEHLKVAHPDMAESIKNMPKDDPLMIEWEKKFRATYEAAPEM